MSGIDDRNQPAPRTDQPSSSFRPSERRRLRAARPHGTRRLAFLLQAAQALASSLDLDATLSTIGRLAVPILADWCAIHVVDGPVVKRVEIVDVRPSTRELVRRLRDSPSSLASPSSPVAEVVRSGTTVVLRQVGEPELARIAPDLAARTAVRELGTRSWVSVPLLAGEHLHGVLSLVSGDPGRQCRRADLRLVEDFAGQASVALANARRYYEAEEALRLRDEMLALVTHDLKAPLTHIKAAVYLLRLLSDAGDPARLKQALAIIEQSGTRLAAQVDELLDIAQLGLQQPLKLIAAETDLVALVEQVVARNTAGAADQRIRVELPTVPLHGGWDAIRLERVLDNLLDNARKYSPAGGTILISLALEERPDGAWAVLRVQDQGVGIPPADLPRIFEPFHRGGNVTRRFVGTGIGLAGCRTIVEQHGGTITAESQVGIGSTFIVRLPLV